MNSIGDKAGRRRGRDARRAETSGLLAVEAAEGILGEDLAAEMRGLAVAAEYFEGHLVAAYSARQTSP